MIVNETTLHKRQNLGQSHKYIQNVAGLNVLAGSQPSPNLGQWYNSTTYLVYNLVFQCVLILFTHF